MSLIDQYQAVRAQALANYFVASKQMEQAEREIAAAETAINAMQQQAAETQPTTEKAPAAEADHV